MIRLQSLHALNILDTPPDDRLDSITRYLAQILDVPICLVTLVDTYRQWFKSTWGLDETEVPRRISICSHAIYEIESNKPEERIYEIFDIEADLRFFDNPLVQGKNGLRSYISYVLQSESGQNIGTLCIANTHARKYSDKEKYLIISMGKVVNNIITRKNYASAETKLENSHQDIFQSLNY